MDDVSEGAWEDAMEGPHELGGSWVEYARVREKEAKETRRVLERSAKGLGEAGMSARA